MPETLTARCSALPRLRLCPASGLRPEMELATGGPEADLGTAFHFGQAQAIEGNRVEPDVIASMYGVDAEEVGLLLRLGWQAWQALSGYFPAPLCEVPLAYADGELTLTGHADVLSVVGDEVRVADWKSGFADEDHDWQLRGYAFLALQEHPEAKTAYSALIRVREGTSDGQHFTREQMAGWWQELKARLGRREYSPGRQCGYCPHGLTCEAKARYLRNSVNALVQLHDVQPPPVAMLYDALRAVETLCEATREVLKAEVRAQGGTLPMVDGRELRLVEQHQRKIDPARGWPVLREHLAAEQILAAATLSKTKIESAISDMAPRGQKGKAIAAVLEQLDQAGAVITTTIEKLEVRRAAAAIDHQGSDPQGAAALAAGKSA